MTMSSSFSDRLARLRPPAFVLYAGLAGFCAYFSMYAFRKPFTAATYETVIGDWSLAIDYKVALVIAQAVGYALSKWIGVRVIAEVGRRRRAILIAGLIGLSWLALILFAITPRPWNVAALFLNGLPLGLIWGLVFSYMEGRRVSDVLGAILCSSFIVSSGVVKTVGKQLLLMGVDESWMPVAAGAVFMPLLLLSVVALSQIPPPSAEDEAARTARGPMDAAARHAFLVRHWPGLLALVLAYVLFTAFRDLRDNFAAELWSALGQGDSASVFVATEIPIAVVALLVSASMIFLRRNAAALMTIHAVMAGGALLLGVAAVLFANGLVSPFVWITLSGLGVYIAYTPFNAVLFDRLVAATGQVANAGFLIYLADASGYVGSVCLLLIKALSPPQLDWVSFFLISAMTSSVLAVALCGMSAWHFRKMQQGSSGR